MAEERGYTRQLGPAPAQRATLATPEVYGAGVGREMESAGQQLHGQKIRAREIERRQIRDQEWTDASARIAEREAEITAQVAEARANAAPGAAGHVDAVRKAAAEGWDDIADGVTENAVRLRIQQRRDAYIGQTVERETLYQVAKNSEKVATDADNQVSTRANMVATGDDVTFVDQSREWDNYVQGLEGIPGDAKDKLRRQGHQRLTLGYLDGLNERDPHMSLALIEGGAFNDVLDDNQLQASRQAAHVEIRRKEAAAERQIDAEKAALRERVQTYSEANSQGIDIGDVSEDAALARSIGDTSTALKLEGMMADNQLAKVYVDATPLQRERRSNDLRNKANPTPAEQRELKWLDDHQASLDGKFDRDPVGFAMENAPANARPPLLEFGSVDSWNKRIRWASAAAETYGRETPILSVAETKALQDLKEGENGEFQVLEELDNIPDAFARKRVARQIDPKDATFQTMALLQPQVRGTVRAGARALKADSGLLKPDADHPEIAETMASWDRRLQFALREFDPADVEAMRIVGRQYLAGILTKTGSRVEAMRESSYVTALRIGMGGENKGDRELGGIGQWREMPFAVPETMTAREVGAALMADRKRRDGNPPVNPDGSLLQLTKAYPVYIGGGRYYWETNRGATVRARDGSVYVSEVKVRP